MRCRIPIVTRSFENQVFQVSSVSGLLAPVSGANAVLGLAAFVARTSSGVASSFVPFASRPVPFDTSATLRVALPAVLVTVAESVAS